MTTPTQSTSPAGAVQQAFVAVLKADGPLKVLLGGRDAVYDQPPEGEAYPYVRVGEHLSTADNDHTSFGREITETLRVWTKARSNKQGTDIATRIGQLLDHQVARVDAVLRPLGHRCVTIRLEYDQALTDPDPQIRQHVLRFRLQTQQLT